MPKNVYISGGEGRLSLYDSALGGRLPKHKVASLFRGAGLHFQKHPTLETDIILLHDDVELPSVTTLSKVRPTVKVMHWRAFKKKYYHRSGGVDPQVLQSLEEEKQLSKGTRRHWRVQRGEAIVRRNSSRPSKTRGWVLDFPTRGRERQEVVQACGQGCFLGPNLSFPICKRCVNGRCSCQIDPRGVQAAYQRARQYGHTRIAERADRLRKSLA